MEKVTRAFYFRDPTRFAAENLIYSDGMGVSTAPELLINRFYFDNFAVMHVTEGVLVLEQYGRIFRISEGESVMVNLRDPHKYYFDLKVGGKMIWFHFNGFPAEKLMDSMKKSGLLPAIRKISGIADKIYRLQDQYVFQEDLKEFLVSGMLYEIIMMLAGDDESVLQQDSEQIPGFCQDMTRYIRHRIQENLTLEEMARHACMSRSKFSRLFRETFGCTPFDYIRKEKIDTAKQLLLCTNQSICEIGSYLHYYDQSYFTNIFEKTVGCTPRQYRIRNSREYETCLGEGKEDALKDG